MLARTRDSWNARALLEGVRDSGKRDGAPQKLKTYYVVQQSRFWAYTPRKAKARS